ncbi:uncharacterized protein METZ01_LOCUS159707 [marine metagenome]|uniref:Uncharacterized protein n=1 Tax=marine metagenome TaxID=408172 RepID=A0A382B0R3_9ZZZZ
MQLSISKILSDIASIFSAEYTFLTFSENFAFISDLDI